MAAIFDILIPIVATVATAVGAALVGAGLILERLGGASATHSRQLELLVTVQRELRSSLDAMVPTLNGLADHREQAVTSEQIRKLVDNEHSRTINALMLLAQDAIERKRAAPSMGGSPREGYDRG